MRTYIRTYIHTYRHTYILTLHYITLHYITLHYITLHYITLHYITLHYITLHYITLHYITYIQPTFQTWAEQLLSISMTRMFLEQDAVRASSRSGFQCFWGHSYNVSSTSTSNACNIGGISNSHNGNGSTTSYGNNINHSSSTWQ